jgi:hypothetical protein
MGSLRSSMYQLNIAGEAASSKVSKFEVSRFQSFRVSMSNCEIVLRFDFETLKL